MNGPGSTSDVWLEATAIVSRFPSATIIPAAVLVAIAEVPHYFIEEHPLLDNTLTYVSAALAYYLYLAYAEEIVVEYERGMEHITMRGMLRELWDATSYVWRVLADGLVTLAISGVATGLLVIPGAWLYTRWSLSTPAITATLAFVLEEASIHIGAVGGNLASGPHTWGEWNGDSTVAAIAIPLVAFTTSIAYERSRSNLSTLFEFGLITILNPMNAFPTMQILKICGKRDENGEHVEVEEIVPDALDCGERLAAHNDPGTSSRSHRSTDDIATEAGCRYRYLNGSLVSRVWFSTYSNLYLVA